jgi:hypothetical protein
MKRKIGQQGEIAIIKLDSKPEGATKPVAPRADGKYIISHSEKGHHHTLDHGDVLEKIDVPSGMQIFWAAIANAEARLEQEAGKPHDAFVLEPGWYEFRISREYNPFLEEARRVAD